MCFLSPCALRRVWKLPLVRKLPSWGYGQCNCLVFECKLSNAISVHVICTCSTIFVFCLPQLVFVCVLFVSFVRTSAEQITHRCHELKCQWWPFEVQYLQREGGWETRFLRESFFVQQWVTDFMALQREMDDRYDRFVILIFGCLVPCDDNEFSCICVFSYLSIGDICVVAGRPSASVQTFCTLWKSWIGTDAAWKSWTMMHLTVFTTFWTSKMVMHVISTCQGCAGC